MGLIADALSAPSVYRVKKTAAEGGYDLWSDLKDRIEGAILIADLNAVAEWLDAYPLEYPEAWREPLDELIEAKREELMSEDVGLILRERFDF